MSEEDKKAFRRRQEDAGNELAIIHPGDSAGSPANASQWPWKQFLETIDGEGTIPGLMYYRDTNGVIKRKWALDGSGLQQVTEASGTTIAANTNISNYQLQAVIPTFHSSSIAYGDMDKRRIGQLLLTTDGAGNCAATTAVAAVAGYTGHIEILGAWSADSGATTPIITLAVTAGTILGISVITWTSASNTPVTLGFGSCGLFARGTIAADDNKVMTIAMSAGGATKNYYISYRYWYET